MVVPRPRHPSEKPVRYPKIGVCSIWRVPGDGPVIPRLQKPEGVHAIGFTARICAEDDE
jgi:hypothetical protein